MKGYSSSAVIGIIVAVLIAVFVLFILWSRGMLPFSKAASETDCMTKFTRDCQNAMYNEWDSMYFDDVKGCKEYVRNKNAFECCIENNNCDNFEGNSWDDKREESCKILCKDFV